MKTHGFPMNLLDGRMAHGEQRSRGFMESRLHPGNVYRSGYRSAGRSGC